MKLLAAITTVENIEDARRIAKAAIETKLAACAQFESIGSVYRWNGQTVEATEVRITFKTTDSRWPELRSYILSMHPYELPELCALELTEVNASYLQWVAATTDCISQ